MVPRSISPTMASCEIRSAISGRRKMVRLERLTITTSRARTPTLPVGALPRKVRLSASAASSSVVASTQRLRRPLADLLAGDDENVSHAVALLRAQEVDVELVKGRGDHLDVLDGSVADPAQERDLGVRRRVDLDHRRADPPPAVELSRASSESRRGQGRAG